MFGFFKNLLRRSADAPAEYQEPDAPTMAATQDTITEPLPEPAPKPQPRRNLVTSSSKVIEVPLEKILTGLPLELQPRVRAGSVDGMTMSIPLEKVLSQLSRGSVKISFGELRLAAPDIFTSANDRDRVLVALPLGEILARMNPALIQRRRAQMTVEVPDDVRSPFDLNNLGALFTSNEPASPAASRRAPAPVPSPEPPPFESAASTARKTLTSAPKPAAPTAIPAPPAAPIKPATPAPIAMRPPMAQPTSAQTSTFRPPSAPLPPKPLAASRPAPVPANGSTGLNRGNGNGTGQFHRLDTQQFQGNGAGQPIRMPAAAPETPAKQDQILVGLTALADGWPDAIRKEIVELNLVEARVGLPAESVEQSLRQGRIAFSWKTLRSWIKPPVTLAASPNDGIVLELQLKVVAPLFLARQREQTRNQQKVEIDVEIPNLFFGFPQAEKSAAAVTTPADSNYYVWDDGAEMLRTDVSDVKRSPGTQFVSKYATPNEIVSRAASLEGVSGALIALPDGLMVASQLPPEINGETLAAFLPQIFGKVSQCTKELRMGDLNNLHFTVGNVPWKIYRVNAIFFAAFGRPGEILPTGQLAALAAELDHKPK